MLYIKIECGSCGNDFEIYNRDINPREDPIRCPHCLRKMDRKHWGNLIDAFLTACDWNYQNRKANQEHDTPLFQVEFVSKHVPQKMILESLELEE